MGNPLVDRVDVAVDLADERHVEIADWSPELWPTQRHAPRRQP